MIINKDKSQKKYMLWFLNIMLLTLSIIYKSQVNLYLTDWNSSYWIDEIEDWSILNFESKVNTCELRAVHVWIDI